MIDMKPGTKKGLTLIELIITIAMFAVLTGVIVYVFNTVLLSWSSSETRSGIDITLNRTAEEMVRDLRKAKKVSLINNDELRFTQDNAAYYIYYFYNGSDTYPPLFSQSSYQLKKAALTGGISGTFTYGSGNIIISDALPPPTSDLSFSGNIATIDLSVKRNDETKRSRTEVRPRNL